MDKLETEMKEKHDELDKQKDAQLEAIKKQNTDKSNTKRMIAMTYPKKYILIGFVAALLSGCVMPVFSIILTNILYGLNINLGEA
jgi:ribulose 1,5-bisphosphate carboxylase large subunit-like protein